MGWFTSVTLSEKNGNDRPQDDKGCILSLHNDCQNNVEKQQKRQDNKTSDTLFPKKDKEIMTSHSNIFCLYLPEHS